MHIRLDKIWKGVGIVSNLIFFSSNDLNKNRKKYGKVIFIPRMSFE